MQDDNSNMNSSISKILTDFYDINVIQNKTVLYVKTQIPKWHIATSMSTEHPSQNAYFAPIIIVYYPK